MTEQEQEQEYDDGVFDSWKQSGPTRRLLKAYREKLNGCVLELEGNARRSTDPDVRASMAKVTGCRVVIAELQGSDQIGVQQ